MVATTLVGRTHFFPRSPASLTEETSFPYCFVSVLGDIVPTATIYQNLKCIVEDPSPPPKFPVAALTTENRDTWANIRRVLQAEPGNEEALRLIDSAIFVLCLDDHGVESVADVTRTFLHGDGTNRLDMSRVAEIVSIETTIIILDKIK